MQGSVGLKIKGKSGAQVTSAGSDVGIYEVRWQSEVGCLGLTIKRGVQDEGRLSQAREHWVITPAQVGQASVKGGI